MNIGKKRRGGRNNKGHKVRWVGEHEGGEGHADLSHKSKVDRNTNVIVYLN